ncbi:bis(5'-nucleosyl)-tetraphosphatase (symmetrical) ApaH [Vibrio sp. ZSDE26]|uniref:Bis(5'-nucleosyl)-tetraphosphatase, symmetrical n=1 Tax=Vibrio amylolyticus TaxID=2847292 RepID=A0A9X1XIJ0_9VIBR|nr:bis(5'-nucleosyl)-tetraphosphatase (symmetrical) ApaH [Vibrio amylolyticus]MCK6263021.1 bis(5'-nucleosyl)-tetraphosphatase (symmetrical) ApaH [Vibrio amylolyticus]
MSTYIVGDLQGCFDELQCLLEKVKFTTDNDTLWVTGDLVARGPKSLETLRFIKSLGASAQIILGNHDLHLLGVSLGIHKVKDKDKTAPIFDAPDKEELLNWLRHQPLLAEHDDFVMTHAGISPQWSLKQAKSAAKEVEQVLKSDRWQWLIENMYSNTPSLWNQELQGIERYRYSINALTRMRYCYSDSSLDMACKLPPSQQMNQKGNELTPWFMLESRLELEKAVVFGHWAALEGYDDKKVIGLDTGCVWGGKLTMLRWEDKRYFEQEALSQ